MAADAGHRQPAAAVKWTPNPASRPANVWNGAEWGVALPSQASYPQPSLHRAPDLPGMLLLAVVPVSMPQRLAPCVWPLQLSANTKSSQLT